MPAHNCRGNLGGIVKPRRLWFCILSALFATAALSPAATLSRPNIILFVSDDHGVDFTGCYGNKAVHTPNMDRLAAEGLRFTRMFAGSPTCSPSRAILFTGLHSARNGTMGNHTNCRADILALPAHLKTLGYRVVAADKTDVRPPSVFTWETLRATLPPNPNQPRRYRGEGLDTAKVDEFLAEHAKLRAGEPLCLIIGDNAPHVIWERNRDFDPAALPVPSFMVDTPKTRMALANYYQDIATMDRHLGEVLASLRRHGFESNTLFICTTDQGPEWPHCKWTCYDTGLRVPFIARWPGVIKPGTTTDALASFVDMMPTFVDVAGGKPVEGIDGRSLKDVLLGRTKTFRDEIFASHTGDGEMNVFPQRCVRDSRFKFILNLHPERKWTTHFTKVMDIPDSHGDVYSTWLEKAKTDASAARLVQLIENHPAEELYDTEADPHELNNLRARPEHAARAAAMRAKLLDWMRAQNDPGLTELAR